MMGENQFHYTLITTYSSGRHLCTDPVLATSAALALSVPVCVFMCLCVSVFVCVCERLSLQVYAFMSFYLVPNKINSSVMTHMYNLLPCSFQVLSPLQT